jgi:hypothetical protein
MPPGTYTIRLIADGQTSTQQARVLRDPRVPASEADLRAQYVLATQVAALLSEVHASRAKAQDLAKRLSGAQAQALRSEVIGEAMPSNPDDSMGAYSHDVSSFLFLENELDYLGSAIESADAAPTPDMRTAYDRLAAKYQATLARLHVDRNSGPDDPAIHHDRRWYRTLAGLDGF